MIEIMFVQIDINWNEKTPSTKSVGHDHVLTKLMIQSFKLPCQEINAPIKDLLGHKTIYLKQLHRISKIGNELTKKSGYWPWACSMKNWKKMKIFIFVSIKWEVRRSKFWNNYTGKLDNLAGGLDSLLGGRLRQQRHRHPARQDALHFQCGELSRRAFFLKGQETTC